MGLGDIIRTGANGLGYALDEGGLARAEVTTEDDETREWEQEFVQWSDPAQACLRHCAISVAFRSCCLCAEAADPFCVIGVASAVAEGAGEVGYGVSGEDGVFVHLVGGEIACKAVEGRRLR